MACPSGSGFRDVLCLQLQILRCMCLYLFLNDFVHFSLTDFCREPEKFSFLRNSRCWSLIGALLETSDKLQVYWCTFSIREYNCCLFCVNNCIFLLLNVQNTAIKFSSKTNCGRHVLSRRGRRVKASLFQTADSVVASSLWWAHLCPLNVFWVCYRNISFAWKTLKGQGADLRWSMS